MLLVLLTLACGGAAPPPAPTPAAPAPTAPAPAAPAPAAQPATAQAPAAPASPAVPDDFCAGSGTWRVRATPDELRVLQDAWTIRQATPDATDCGAHAYVIDPDPAGLNVRAAPDVGAAVLTTINRETTVTLAAQKGNWFLICQGDSGFEESKPIAAAGWVYNSKLGTGTRGYDQGHVPLLAAPETTAAEVGRVGSETELTLSDCHGSWVKGKAQGTSGWLPPDEQCNNQVTTCP